MSTWLLLQREDAKMVPVDQRSAAQEALIAIKGAYDRVITSHYSASAVAEFDRLMGIIKNV